MYSVRILKPATKELKKLDPSVAERIVHFPEGDNIDFFLGGTRVSFVRFPFPNVEPTETREGVRMAVAVGHCAGRLPEEV